MAITFESVKDPYGLGAAGSAIGGALMDKAMMDYRQSLQQSETDRLRQQEIDTRTTLGKTLKDFIPKEGESWDENRLANFMSKALESGASMNDIINSVKALQGNQGKPVPPSPFMKELGKKNVQLYDKFTEHGRKANEMLGLVPSLEQAINDPERFDNFLYRSAKGLPFADKVYGASDQVMNNFSKEFVSNFSAQMPGLRLTDAKLQWLQGVPPAPWKTKEANQTSLANAKRLLQIQDAYGNTARAIANSYLEAGLDVPPNYEKLVEDAVAPLRKEIDEIYDQSVGKEGKMASGDVEIGQKFKKMPDPKEYEGAEITDSKGNKYVSTGAKWRKVK